MNLTIKDKVLISSFTALTAIGAYIRVPIPYIPFTMQFFFCSMSGVVLGGRKGALSQLLYVAIGLMGIPIFTKGGGPQYIFEPSFGYLIGLIFAAYVIGKTTYSKEINFKNIFFSNLLGLGIIYFIGIIYLYIINHFYLGTNMTLKLAIYYGFITTILGDIVKALLVAGISMRILSQVNMGVNTR